MPQRPTQCARLRRGVGTAGRTAHKIPDIPKSDIPLQALCDRLVSERNVKADTSMMSRFFRQIAAPCLKKPSSHASRIARTSIATANDGEPISGSSTPGGWSSSMKPPPSRGQALDQDQYDPPARLGAKGPVARRQGPAGQEDRDVRRRLANDRIDAPCLFDGPINGERFHAYVEQFLVPTGGALSSCLNRMQNRGRCTRLCKVERTGINQMCVDSWRRNAVLWFVALANPLSNLKRGH
jgi:hypothetical protein